MGKHNATHDKEKNKEALGLIKRGRLNDAAEILKSTSNKNQTEIKNRLLKAKGLLNG